MTARSIWRWAKWCGLVPGRHHQPNGQCRGLQRHDPERERVQGRAGEVQLGRCGSQFAGRAEGQELGKSAGSAAGPAIGPGNRRAGGGRTVEGLTRQVLVNQDTPNC